MAKPGIRLLLVLLAVSGLVRAENYRELVKEGNAAYDKGDYQQALDYYHSAETELPESPELEYNLAGALHQDGALEQSVEKYQKAINTDDPQLEASARYNLGNTYFRMQDYVKAIESYESALKLNPKDMDAKYNLELARRRLKEQTQPEQQQQQQQEQQQQQDQEQQQRQQQQQQDQQQQQQQQQQEEEENQQLQSSEAQQSEEQERQQQQQQQSQQQKQEISKEDAERILNALYDDEQEIQKKVKRQKVTGRGTGKDW